MNNASELERSKRWRVRLAIVIVMLVAVFIAFSIRPAVVAFHAWRMEHARSRIEASPREIETQYDTYSDHRERLVKLGTLGYWEFVLENVPHNSNNERIVARLLKAKAPNASWELPWRKHNRLSVEIWDAPEEYEKWQAFFASLDRSDFVEHFDSPPDEPGM